MSEITKACYLCRGTGQCVSNGMGGFSDCPRCSATGRVPDVEATLLAGLAEATTQLRQMTVDRDKWRESSRRKSAVLEEIETDRKEAAR